MRMVEIPVGIDRFHAQVIADTCRQEGIDVEILEFDHTRYEIGLAGAVENRVIVRADDELAARRVIADMYPDMVIAHQDWPTRGATRSHSLRTRILAYLLAVLFLGPVVVGAVSFFAEVF